MRCTRWPNDICSAEHKTRQNAAIDRADAAEGVCTTTAEQCVRTCRETKDGTRVRRRGKAISSGIAAKIRELNERSTGRAVNRTVRAGSGRHYDRRSLSPLTVDHYLRVRQIKAGKVPGRIHFNALVEIRREEKLDTVGQTDLEAHRHIRDINITRIAVIVADGRRKGEFTLTEILPVIDREKSGRAADSTTGTDRRCSVPRIAVRTLVFILRRDREYESQNNERTQVRHFSEFHHIPPPKKN